MSDNPYASPVSPSAKRFRLPTTTWLVVSTIWIMVAITQFWIAVHFNQPAQILISMLAVLPAMFSLVVYFTNRLVNQRRSENP